jgi:hypothetical protein
MNVSDVGEPQEPQEDWSDSRERGEPRRSYSVPVLVLYGSLTDLTRATGNDEFDGIIGSGQVT